MEKEKVKKALAFAGITQSKMADVLGYTQANFSTKVKKETLTDDELKKIADSIGAVYKCYFEFKDGTKI